MKRLFLFVISVVTILGLAACGKTAAAPPAASAAPSRAAGDEVGLTLAHALDTEHPVHLGSVYFADRLQELSGGMMKVSVHPDSELGDEEEVAEMQSYSDSVTFSVPSGWVLQPFTGAAYAFDFYFQFDNYDQVWAFYDGEYGDYVKKELEGSGLVVLDFWDNGFRNLTTTDKEIHTPADLKGLKIRVMNADTHLAAWNALGAETMPITYAYVYSALQQGVVAGEENPVFNIYGSKFYEVQKYIHLDRHVHDVSPFLVSGLAWNSFTDEQKGWIRQASREAALYMRQKAVELEDEDLKKLEDAGMTVVYLSEEELQMFRDAVSGVPAAFRERMGETAYAEYEKCIAAVH